ncbi:MAG: sugar ABC transporter permease [Oscillospiraceae bacterium]|nr:sugar ABC transporter permease [Oscillospiraceae bacterium]
MRKLQRFRNTLQYELLLLPALVIFAIFILYPAFNTIYSSFTNWNRMNIKNIQFVGIENYQKLFSDKSVLIGVRNSFIYAISATVLQSAGGLGLALILNRAFKTKNFLRAVWYFPAVLSTLVIGFLWNYMLSSSDLGLINSIIQGFGFSKVNFLGNGNNALMSIIFIAVWQWMGWTMTIYLANLQGIPEELYESAAIDGASKTRLFFGVTLPMLFPAISFSAITGMIQGLKMFDLVYALTKGGPNGRTETIITLMIKKGFTEGFYSYACAIGAVFLVIVLCVTMFQMRYFNRWGENIS